MESSSGVFKFTRTLGFKQTKKKVPALRRTTKVQRELANTFPKLLLCEKSEATPDAQEAAILIPYEELSLDER